MKEKKNMRPIKSLRIGEKLIVLIAAIALASVIVPNSVLRAAGPTGVTYTGVGSSGSSYTSLTEGAGPVLHMAGTATGTTGGGGVSTFYPTFTVHDTQEGSATSFAALGAFNRFAVVTPGVFFGDTAGGGWTAIYGGSSTGFENAANAFSFYGDIVEDNPITYGGAEMYKLSWSNFHMRFGNAYYDSATMSVASGFGTSPALGAKASDTTGSLTVGTGGAASGVINFAHTWANIPNCIAQDTTTGNLMRPTPSTTQLTITGTMVAADKVVWICLESM